MKLTKFNLEQLTKLAQEEFAIDTNGMTKAQIRQALVDVVVDGEIDDDVAAQYLEPVVTPPVGPVSLDDIIAKARIAQGEFRKELDAANDAASRFVIAPFEADVLITSIQDRSTVNTKQGPMEMITIVGKAFPNTPKELECKVTTNIEWVRDFTIEVGKTTKARVGILTDEALNEQAEEVVKRRAGTKRPVTLDMAKAIVGNAQLILGGETRSFADIIVNKQIKRELVGPKQYSEPIQREPSRMLTNSRMLSQLLAGSNI